MIENRSLHIIDSWWYPILRKCFDSYLHPTNTLYNFWLVKQKCLLTVVQYNYVLAAIKCFTVFTYKMPFFMPDCHYMNIEHATLTLTSKAVINLFWCFQMSYILFLYYKGLKDTSSKSLNCEKREWLTFQNWHFFPSSICDDW